MGLKNVNCSLRHHQGLQTDGECNDVQETVPIWHKFYIESLEFFEWRGKFVREHRLELRCELWASPAAFLALLCLYNQIWSHWLEKWDKSVESLEYILIYWIFLKLEDNRIMAITHKRTMVCYFYSVFSFCQLKCSGEFTWHIPEMTRASLGPHVTMPISKHIFPCSNYWRIWSW